MLVWFHSPEGPGTWSQERIRLRDPERDDPLWVEHPAGSAVDLVAVALPTDFVGAFYALDVGLADFDLDVLPGEPASIIGFPHGKGVEHRFPIWITGHLASDLELNYDGKPVCLIDANTTKGMSGSPVVARRVGPYRSSRAMLDFGDGSATRFLGVYSGRIDERTSVGMVWKPHLIAEILSQVNRT